MRDASLICPPGIEGIIVGVKIFSRKGIEKDDRAKAIEQEELDMMEKNLQDEIRILHDEVKKRVLMMLKGTAQVGPVRRIRRAAVEEGHRSHPGDSRRDALRDHGPAEDPRPTTRTSRMSCAISRTAPSGRSR